MMRKWCRHPAKTSRESSVAPASRRRLSRTPYEICGRGEPPIFLQVLIPGGFKSNDFASADSKGFAETFFVSDVMRHAPPGARVGTLALDRSASAGTGGVNGSVHRS